MARPQREYSQEEKQEIIKAYNRSKNVWEQKRLLCIKLRVEQAMPAKAIAEIVGCAPVTVDIIISKYAATGLESLLYKKRGGNHRNLQPQEEVTLLEPFMEEAKSGRMLLVTDIHKAYEKALNSKVALSTVYRMLKRQGFRKIMPRGKHPKSKPEEFEGYKKNQ